MNASLIPTFWLFFIPSLIWGSTWLAITWQLGTIATEVSVTYRFALAALLLGAGCVATRRSLRFGARDQAFLAAMGLLMVSINYVLVYEAERRVTSGLVAVLYSTIVFVTPIGARVAFGDPFRPRLLAAAALGVAGIALLYLPDLERAGDDRDIALGVVCTLLAVIACAAGNLIAARNHRAGIPTITGSFWMFAWGALFAAAAALVAGVPFAFDARPGYVLSLVYLSVAGSIVAFVTYFTLLQRVGVSLSSYTAVLTPVIAMLLSTLFEGYRWTWASILGLGLAIAGIALALRVSATAPVRDAATTPT